MTLLQQLGALIAESIVRPDAPPQTVETGDLPAWQLGALIAEAASLAEAPIYACCRVSLGSATPMHAVEVAAAWSERPWRIICTRPPRSSDMGSCLGGTLRRRPDGTWWWSDGRQEPRAEDWSASRQWNFRCRTYGTGETLVEVLRGAAQEHHDLAWVIEGARAGRYRSGESGDHTGPLVIGGLGVRRAHIAPGEDPLHGHEPMPEQRGPIPAVILVPALQWDLWSIQTPVGAIWDREYEADILATAQRLAAGMA